MNNRQEVLRKTIFPELNQNEKRKKRKSFKREIK